MIKHPAGPFRVSVTQYQIAPCVRPRDFAQVYSRRHRSAAGAARRLANIIAGKSEIAKSIKQIVNRDIGFASYGGRYLIECGDGAKYSLRDFQKRFLKGV